jgi:serine/threonine protein phosphatase PrpC
MTVKKRYDSGQASLVGNRRNNQDRCILVESGNTMLLGLADGMGGHPRGEVAAQILMDSCRQLLRRTPLPIRFPGSFLNQLLIMAHEGILAYGHSQNPAIDPRTTAVVALIQDDTAYWVHAGDSRLYLFRNGEVLAQTTDHSYVERLRQQGLISAQQKEKHPQRNYVTRCLGGSQALPEAELGLYQLQPGDVLMLCSDGVWSSIDPELMSDALCSSMTVADAAKALTEEATQAAYPESDNATLIAVRLEAPKPEVQSTIIDSQGEGDELNRAIAELQSAIDNYQIEKKQERP